MSSHHTIRTQKVELSFNNEANAEALHGVVATLCRTVLGEILEACLEKFDLPGVTVLVNKIDIDLGTIHYRELDREMPDRFCKALEWVLRLKFSEADSCNVAKISSATSALESIRYFLQNGCLPWNASRRDLHALVEESLQSSPGELAAMIRNVGRSSHVRHRVAQRLSKHAIEQTITALVPKDAPLIIDFHRHLIIVNNNVALVRSPRNVLEKTLWLFILNNLLVEQGSLFNAVNFAKSVLHQFACHYNIAYGALIQLLRAGINQWKGSVYMPYLNLIQEVIKESDVDEASTERLHDESPEKLFYHLIADRFNLSDGGGEGPLPKSKEVLLRSILRDQKGQFIRFLLGQSDRVGAVERLITNLSDKLRGTLVHFLEPENDRKVLQYRGHMLSVHRYQPLVHVSYQDIDKALWTILIVSLLDSQGSRFNQISFIRTYLTRIAAHYNLRMHELARRICEFVSKMPSCSKRLFHFVQIIQEISSGKKNVNSNMENVIGQPGMEIHAETIDFVLDIIASGSLPLKRSEEQALLRQIRRASREARRHLLREMLVPSYTSKLSALSEDGFDSFLLHMLSSVEAKLFLRWLRHFRAAYPSVKQHFYNRRSYVSSLHYALLQLLLDRRVNAASVKEPESIAAWMTIFFQHNLLMDKESFISGAVAEMNIDSSLLSSCMERLLAEASIRYVDREGGTNVNALIHWLLTTRSRYPVPPPFGFPSYSDALAFAVTYYSREMTDSMMELDHRQLWFFFQDMNADDMQCVSRLNSDFQDSWYSALLYEWAHRLNGFYEQQSVLHLLKKILLWSSHLKLAPSDSLFLSKVCSVFNGYVLSDAFYKNNRHWSLPTHGDISDALDTIEQELEAMAPSNTKKRKALIRKVLPEKIQAEAEAFERRSRKTYNGVEEGEPLFVANAGLVLLHPYFSYLFDQLAFLSNGKFTNEPALMKAITLLHYTVAGVETAKEEDCVLNKVLCGYIINKPLLPVSLTDGDKELVESMLLAFRSHWTAITTHSDADIRGNWLVREGRLSEKEGHWELHVERRPYDLLLAGLPFTLSPVCFSWMAKPMIIHWL